MDFTDTIAAIATPHGEGAVGLVRVSGPKALAIASALSRKKSNPKKAALNAHSTPRQLISVCLANNDELFDDALVALFKKPQSYTGEDVAEFFCHGNPTLLKHLLSACIKQGARNARPGEFTERAFLNGKIDLAQAESVAELIRSRSAKARTNALASLNGVFSHRIENFRNQLLELAARLEAGLDFPEEAGAASRNTIESKLERIIVDIEVFLATSVRARLVRDGVRVVLLGRPNVGKSSLFNALLAFERAIVTDIPGTTRDTLEESLEWNGQSIILIDTAGLRETAGPVEKAGIARTKEEAKEATVQLLLVDHTALLAEEDIAIARDCDPARTLVVVTKVDKAGPLDARTMGQRLGLSRIVETSAKTGLGLSELQKTVEAIIMELTGPEPEGLLVTNERHKDHLEAAVGHLKKARNAIAKKLFDEAAALDIKAALHSLGLITGHDVTEDVLSTIFSTFCIGK